MVAAWKAVASKERLCELKAHSPRFFLPQDDIAMRAVILVLLDPLSVFGSCFAENVNRIGTNILATFLLPAGSSCVNRKGVLVSHGGGGIC